ncbi:hypothetical protein ACLOJK_016998 [Asimina triloba]
MTAHFALFTLFLAFSLTLSNLPAVSASLSTVSITHTTDLTLICALIPSGSQSAPPIANCTSFPGGHTSLPSVNSISFSAIAGGDGFFCGLISGAGSSTDALRCWRFSPSGNVAMYRRRNGVVLPFQRIHYGPRIIDLESGASHFCAILSGPPGRVECWQWPGFTLPSGQNFSSIAVGGDFLCGLTDGGEIECFGPNSTAPEPRRSGNFAAVAAGLRHACAIQRNGGVQCWGQTAGSDPEGEFQSLALGDGRSCALRVNRTVVCWGDDNFQLPGDLMRTEFMEIKATRLVFCGVVAQNFSLVCWGSGNLDPNAAVFDRVLPGPCRTDCPCGPVDGSGNLCSAGSVICRRCGTPESPDIGINPPALQPTPTEQQSSRGRSRARTAYLVVGIVGTAFGVATISCYVVCRICKVKGCRVHDSGRLDEAAEAAAAAQPPSRLPSQQQRIARTLSLHPQLDKRLSHLISIGTGGNVEEFPLEILLQITDNFSEQHKIGSGSFGCVYRATLDDGREVAIKRAEPSSQFSFPGTGIGSKRQEKEQAFLSELATLSRLNHKNLVQLLGYCDDEQEWVLVYEFMPNGTLHDHLHRRLQGSPLASWTERLKVALDAARGIEYLHTYAVPPIIHRDIKSSNILLDDAWTAKVSDFGLSLMGPGDDETHISLRAAGTVGYMDPEYYRLQLLTTKSDVYSFGVVLLELLTGYKAIHKGEECGTPRNVVDFAVPYIVRDDIYQILDPKLPPPTPSEIEAVVYVGYLAADCVSLEGQYRPSMTDIVGSLEKALAACLVQPPSISRSTTQSSG